MECKQDRELVEDKTLAGAPTPRSTARRQHLLGCARNLFVEQGFHKTGMAQIANASGIAIGQIYRDFANKEAIIAAICEADLAAWLDEGRLAKALENEDVEQIHAWLEEITTQEPTHQDRRLMCELLAEIGRNPKVGEINRHAERRVRKSLGMAVESLAPGISEGDRNTTIDFIISLSWGMIARWELSPDSDHAALQRFVAGLLRREVVALASRKM